MREGIPIGTIHIRRIGGAPVHGEANQASRNVRFPSRDRDRERAAIQGDAGAQRGIARGLGASDRNRRGPRYHQPLAHRRAADTRRDCGERGPGLRD